MAVIGEMDVFTVNKDKQYEVVDRKSRQSIEKINKDVNNSNKDVTAGKVWKSTSEGAGWADSDSMSDNQSGGVDITINGVKRTLQKQNETSGSKILWRGMLLAPYGSIEFNIPEDCFHNNKTTVTLVIESHMVKGSGYSDDLKARGTTPMIVTLSMGNSEDFGILDDVDGVYRPFYCEDPNGDKYAIAKVYRSVAEIDSYVVSDNESVNTIELNIKAKKVADSRYAVCYVSSLGWRQEFIITNISAYVPGELGQ